MAKNQETRERFIELRARGRSYAKISEAIKVSKPTLIKWNRQYSDEIEQLQSEELLAMCERFRIARAQRVERFVNMIDRVEEQLGNRDLSGVQTERLLREWIRLMQAVRNELEPERVEVTTRVDPLERWEEIVRQCIDVAEIPAQIARQLTEG